jgi:hypothetical protein
LSNTVYHYPGDATVIMIAPSVLSTDFTRQGEQVANAEAAGDDGQSRFRGAQIQSSLPRIQRLWEMLTAGG